MQILLKNIKIIDPFQKINRESDLLIENGVIKKIGTISEDETADAKIYEMKGKVCSPGFFDMHVHLREPGFERAETIESGCNAAAAGGFTAVAPMPNTNPTTDSAEIVNFILSKAAGHLVDVFPVAAATKNREGEALSPMAELIEFGAVAFTDDGTVIKNSAMLRNCMEYASMYDAPIIEHCEDKSLAGGAMNESFVSTQLGLPSIPTVAEDLIVMRDILMAEYTGAKLHIAHISSKRSVEMVRDAKKRGVKVSAEVTPHHFTLTDESLKDFNTNLKMNPPLRSKKDVEAIIEGLKDGTIDCIATDHAPHTIESKDVEFIYAPNGIVGLETALGLAVTELVEKGHLTLEQLIEKFAVNPRKILNISVPEIKEGEAANLTIFAPEEEWIVNVTKFKSRSYNTPFNNKKLTGKPIAVINKSKLYIDGELINL